MALTLLVWFIARVDIAPPSAPTRTLKPGTNAVLDGFPPESDTWMWMWMWGVGIALGGLLLMAVGLWGRRVIQSRKSS